MRPIYDYLKNKDELEELNETFYNQGTFNLKMHKVEFECIETDEDLDIFNAWCEIKDDIFTDMINWLQTDINLEYIRSTSSFRIEFDNEYKSNDLLYWNTPYERLCEYFQDLGDEGYEIEDLENEVQRFINAMKDVQRVVDYINDFKEHQIELFNDFRNEGQY